MSFEQIPPSQTEDAPEAMAQEQEEENLHAGQTPERLRKGVEKLLRQFLKEKKIEGREHLAEIPPDRRVVIVSSHFSNLDAPLVVDAFGNDMDLQMAVMSTHFNLTDVRNLMLSAAGKKSFSPISYRRRNEGATFNPDDFEAIGQVVKSKNKVPWMAANNMKLDRKMPRTNVGPAYLAEKLDALVIPVAIVLEGSGASIEGAGETLKALKNKLSATVRIGAPLEIPKIDIGFMENIVQKRKRKESVTPEERKQFSDIVGKLRGVANIIGADIAQMLPPDERGIYGEREIRDIENISETERSKDFSRPSINPRPSGRG